MDSLNGFAPSTSSEQAVELQIEKPRFRVSAFCPKFPFQLFSFSAFQLFSFSAFQLFSFSAFPIWILSTTSSSSYKSKTTFQSSNIFPKVPIPAFQMRLQSPRQRDSRLIGDSPENSAARVRSLCFIASGIVATSPSSK